MLVGEMVPSAHLREETAISLGLNPPGPEGRAPHWVGRPESCSGRLPGGWSCRHAEQWCSQGRAPHLHVWAASPDR